MLSPFYRVLSHLPLPAYVLCWKWVSRRLLNTNSLSRPSKLLIAFHIFLLVLRFCIYFCSFFLAFAFCVFNPLRLHLACVRVYTPHPTSGKKKRFEFCIRTIKSKRKKQKRISSTTKQAKPMKSKSWNKNTWTSRYIPTYLSKWPCVYIRLHTYVYPRSFFFWYI